MQQLQSIKFYLRDGRVNVPTTVYCGVRIEGKLYKIPTGTKVRPNQWSSEQQVAIISNLQNKLDNYNNKQVNEKIEEYRVRHSEYLEYLCNHINETFNINDITEYLTGMAKIKAADLIVRAFNYLYPEPKVVVGRVDSRRVYLSQLSTYLEYLEAKNLTKLDVFKQAGLNCYIKYLTEQGESNAAINVKAGLIVRLVNKVLAVELDFIKYGVKGGIQFNKKADKRPDKGRFALTTTEQQAIGDLELDKKIKYSYSMIVPTSINNIQGDTLSEYRDIFVLQCRTGQRVSDLEQFLKFIVGQPTDKVKQVEVEGQCYYEVKTKKSQGKECALIVEDDYIKTFIGRYSKAGFSLNLDKLDDGKFYNYAIKMLAKLAGIDREITYRNAQDEEITEPAYLKLSSHCARHTFITQKLNEGVSPDKLCYLTGHTDDNMIKTIYSHLTSTDKARMVGEVLGKLRKDKAVDNPPSRLTLEPVDYDRLLGKIERTHNKLGDFAKWLVDNEISIDTLIGYYQRLNPDSVYKVDDVVVRADIMMTKLFTLRELMQGS